MAAPALIDLSNYDTLLTQSTQSRSGVPDGNIFFDVANGRLEIITLEELATVNFGSGLEANPLTQDLGIKLEAIYAFERQERRVDEELRKYDPFLKGTFKFAGAYEYINNRKLDDANGSITSLTGDDRAKIRGSGWIERNSAGSIGRILYGTASLGAIEALSQPYNQLSPGGAPVDYQKDGPISEAVQVYGDAAIDANTTTFDTRTYLSIKVRTFGNNFDEKLLSDSGVTEMGGYSTGFALSETAHLTTGNFTLADVYGGLQVAPWTGMGLEELAVAQVETGFNESDGSFTWVLNNAAAGSLDQCVAFLDALAQTDDDINDHVTNVTNGKRVGTWYSYDAQGRIVTQSGADALGLFIKSIPTADEQSVVFKDDIGGLKTRPFVVGVEVFVGANAVADINAWFHAFYLPAFNSSGAVTVVDSTAAAVKGNVLASHSANKILWSHDYDGDTVGGTAGTDKDVVFECEGDGGVIAAKTVFTMNRQTTVSATCEPAPETNV